MHSADQLLAWLVLSKRFRFFYKNHTQIITPTNIIAKLA